MKKRRIFLIALFTTLVGFPYLLDLVGWDELSVPIIWEAAFVGGEAADPSEGKGLRVQHDTRDLTAPRSPEYALIYYWQQYVHQHTHKPLSPVLAATGPRDPPAA
jgi:hypothetical protein